MPSLLIIADDLTGATDLGAEFARQGIPASVTRFDHFSASNPFEEFEVAVVDTDSRHLDPNTAYDRVLGAAQTGLRFGATHFYKKTDSTLRGNIGSELEALLTATETPFLAYMPALPQFGRTTRGGLQYVNGVPLDETVYANDPLNPVRSSSVDEVLLSQTNLAMHQWSSKSVREEAIQLHPGIHIFDSESNEELQAVGAFLAKANALRVLAGTAGFGSCLPRFIPFGKQPVLPIRLERPALLINGSLNPASLKQLNRALSKGWRPLQLPCSITADPSKWQTALETLLAKRAEREVDNLAIFTVRNREELSDYERSAEITGESLHATVAARTAELVSKLHERHGFRTMIVFGGDTFSALARVRGWTTFHSLGDVARGLTASSIPGQHLTLISKSGGFGAPELVDTLPVWNVPRGTL